MRIGLLADIHGNYLALRRVLEDLEGVDALLFAGDLCGYYPFVNECLAVWPATPVFGVQGNHDAVLVECLVREQAVPPEYRFRYGSALDRSLRSLSTQGKTLVRSWPKECGCEFEGTRVLLVHGAPWDPLEGRVYPDFRDWDRFGDVQADIVVMGHTHYPLARRHDSKLLVNPGSVGQSRNVSGVACCGLLDLPSGEVEFRQVPYPAEPLIADAVAHDPDLTYLADVLVR